MSPEIEHTPPPTLKRPGKPAKPAKPRKPRKMWMLHDRLIEGVPNYLSATKEYTDQSPVLVIDLAPQSVDYLRFKIITAVLGVKTAREWHARPSWKKKYSLTQAEIALAAIGIVAARLLKACDRAGRRRK